MLSAFYVLYYLEYDLNNSFYIVFTIIHLLEIVITISLQCENELNTVLFRNGNN